jgi:hypothetical protein
VEALVVVYAFMAAAFRSDWPSASKDPEALVRLAIPATAALLGLWLRDAYAGPDRPPHAVALDVIAAFALAILSQALLSAFKPELVLPRWAPTQGGFLGMVLLALTRALFPPSAKQDRLLPESGWSAKAYLAATVLFTSAACYLLIAGGAKARTASILVLAGSAYLFFQFRVAKHYGTFLRRASYWYYGCLLPSSLIALQGFPVYLYWVPLVILVFAEVNHRAAGAWRFDSLPSNSLL